MRENESRFRTAFRYAFVIFFCMITLLPVFFAVSSSLKTDMEIATGSGGILPLDPSFDNYIKIFSMRKITPNYSLTFFRFFLNTLEVALVTAALTSVLSSVSAYAIERGKCRERKWLVILLLITLVIGGGTLTMYPLLQIVDKLHITGKFGLSVIQAAQGLPVNTLLYYSFLRGVSRNVDAAAKIDGCSFFGIWRYIIFPMSKPVLAVIFARCFCDSANNYLLPKLMLIGNETNQTLPIAVTNLKALFGSGAGSGLQMAAAGISAIPVLLIFLFANKYILPTDATVGND